MMSSIGRPSVLESEKAPFLYQNTPYPDLNSLFQAAGITDERQRRVVSGRILYYGWDVDRAVNTPVRKLKPCKKKRVKETVSYKGKTYSSLRDVVRSLGPWCITRYRRIYGRIRRGCTVDQAVDAEKSVDGGES